jgi:hypothetical protein
LDEPEPLAGSARGQRENTFLRFDVEIRIEDLGRFLRVLGGPPDRNTPDDLGERIVLRRRGKDVAVLVPVEDLKLLEEIEDRIDIEEAKKALKEKGKIPWTKLKKKLGQ